jgi:peptidoglycan/LPS O-acetylase OafA/YrhL
MILIGLASYSIYLWQQPFLNPISGSSISRFPLNVLLAATASLAAYYFIELPSLALRYKLETVLFQRESTVIIRDLLEGTSQANARFLQECKPSQHTENATLPRTFEPVKQS